MNGITERRRILALNASQMNGHRILPLNGSQVNGNRILALNGSQMNGNRIPALNTPQEREAARPAQPQRPIPGRNRLRAARKGYRAPA